MNDEQGLHLGVEFDTSGAEKAVKRIGKEIDSNQKELARVNQDIARLEQDLLRIGKIINDGTDGIRSGDALLEVQTKHLASATARYEELLNKRKELNQKEKESVSTLQQYEKVLSDANSIKGIDQKLKEIKKTVSDIQVDRLDRTGKDTKLDDLIVGYNKLAKTYENTVEKVNNLRNAIEFLQEEQSKLGDDKGIVSEHINQRLAEYNKQLRDEETNLDTVQHKIDKARTSVEGYVSETEKQAQAERERIAAEQEAEKAMAEQIQKAKEAGNVNEQYTAQAVENEKELVAELSKEVASREELKQRNQEAADEILRQAESEEKVAESASRAEAEFAKIKEEVRNITVGDGMDFQSISGKLSQMKEAVRDYKAEEEELTKTLEQQNNVIKTKKSSLDDLINGGASVEQVKRKAEEIASLEQEAENTRIRLDAVKAAIYDIRQEYSNLSNFPMKVDLEGVDKARDDVKQLDSVLKTVQGTASSISFPKLDIDTDDLKLQSLIDKYNTLAAQYDTQSAKVSELRAQIIELRRKEAEEQSKGAVSTEVIARLTEYTNKLSTAEAKLSSLMTKTQSARRAVSDYTSELSRSQSVAGKVADYVSGQMGRIGNSFERVVTRLKNMIFRFVVMRVLYAAFNSLKNIMSSVMTENTSLGNSFTQLKQELLVAFYPVINLLSKGLETLIGWLIKATQYVGAFIRALTGTSAKEAVEGAKRLYDTMNAEKSAKSEKKAIEEKIKARQKEIKALEKQAKAVKAEYDEQKKAINRKKDALDDEIDAVNKTIEALRKQESAEKKAAQALKDSITAQINALKAQKSAREDQINHEKKAISDEISAIEKEIKALQKQKEAREAEIEAEERNLAGFDTLQILQGSEEEDPEIKRLDEQINLLEDKKDALNEVNDSIPTGSDDPLIAQIEAQIEALEKQKEAIEDIDYSDLINQQQDLIQSYRDQKEKLDEMLEKLQDKYDLKISGIDEAKQGIQDIITQLQTEKSEIESARNEAAKPQEFKANIKGTEEVEEKVRGLINTVKTKFEELKKLFKSWADKTGLTEQIENLKERFSSLKTSVSEMVEALKIAFSTDDPNGFVKFIKSAFETVKGIVEDKVLLIGELISDLVLIFELGAKLIEAVAEGRYVDALDLLIDIFKVKINMLIAQFENLIKAVLRALAELIDPLGIIKWEYDSKEYSLKTLIDSIHLPRLEIPGLAQGAVLPGGKPFLAMLGDQPSGQTNIETPEKLMRQVFAEELAKVQLNNDVTIHFDGSLSQLARVLQPYIEVANKRASAFA